MTQEELLRLPKVELHCHLDGSLSQEFIEKRLGRSVKKEELSVSDDCTSLAEYLEKFDMPCQCLKDEEGLEEAGYDVLKSMSREHVCYAEIRFAPLRRGQILLPCRTPTPLGIWGLRPLSFHPYPEVFPWILPVLLCNYPAYPHPGSVWHAAMSVHLL